MIVLRIEHKIANYAGWKRAFENDPINRKQSGVIRYRIYRPVDDEAFVIIDLEFEHPEQALETMKALENIFPKIEGSIIFGVQLKILEVIETVEI
ncbi:MAG TPA: hypothetical protein P5275_19115 [Saprospiraceae bacterium]|nr:hypothetical protein [Saprospiraceae bacterium]HRV86992.1 hypothetical protein [Saprospiraceae bacterium]